MIHERVDIERWKAMFPLSALRQQAREFVLARQAAHPEYYADDAAVERHVELMSPGGERVTSPYHIAVIENLRDEAFAGRPPDGGVPTDVVIFARGEPARREVTKVGGLPYWPAAKPWPHTAAGKPMFFVAQLCFADSTELTGRLPGDLLLVFGNPESMWGDEEDDEDAPGVRLEWMRVGSEPLVTPGEVPETEWALSPCYGALHRTRDYPGAEQLFSQYRYSYQLNVFEGTKIGGLPRWIQPGYPDFPHFLGAVGSIQPASDRPYPWLNQPEPITSDQALYDDGLLMWGDAGSLFLCLDSRGDVHPTIQCY